MHAARHCLAWIALAGAACSERPTRRTTATIVDIAPRVSRWRADEVLVTARSGDGLIGMKAVETSRLNCRIGDRVHATAQGESLSLGDEACER